MPNEAIRAAMDELEACVTFFIPLEMVSTHFSSPEK
jgi:hypothetical protein